MSRKKIWFYTLILCAAFTITLAVVAPPLALAPMAFTVIFMTALTGSLLLSWLFDGIRYSQSLLMFATGLMLFVFLTVGGSPIGGVVAFMLTGLVYWAHKRTNRKPPVPVTSTAPMVTAGYTLHYGVQRAAGQVH